MLRFCPEKGGDEANYLKKKKVSHQVEASEEVIKARDATTKIMGIIDEDKMDENTSLQGGEVQDESENEESGGLEDLDEEMSLQKEIYQVKEKEGDLMEDEDVVLAGGASRSLVKSSAYSKYAPNSVGMTMQVDKREEMLGMTSLRQETQRKREAFDLKMK
ncbi:hypothetical protein G6F42_028383 [Rhizopus arrhizus]|nr:hypothetical protein G6F42_028383 [Rhizopus arrhizus]